MVATTIPAASVAVESAEVKHDPLAIMISPELITVSGAHEAPPDQSIIPPARQAPPARHDDLSLDVRELLAKHAAKVGLVRELVETHEHFHPARHDGLFLLRYLLSHKLKVKEASRAARHSLQLRHEWQLDRIAAIVRSRPCQEWPHFKALDACGGVYYVPCRPTDESAAETEAWRALDDAVARRETPAAAAAAAQRAFAAGGGLGEWAWCRRPLFTHEVVPLTCAGLAGTRTASWSCVT